jgi:hypothetical protein
MMGGLVGPGLAPGLSKYANHSGAGRGQGPAGAKQHQLSGRSNLQMRENEESIPDCIHERVR